MSVLRGLPLTSATQTVRRRWVMATGALVAAAALAPGSARAQFSIPASIDAPTALQLSQSGKTTLIDIRRPDEWRATGVPKGAKRINMLQPQGPPGFVAEVLASVNGDKAAPITLICRTGNRTSQMQAFLKANGFANVSHVGEGVAGSAGPGGGPGWAARGLPLEPGP